VPDLETSLSYCTYCPKLCSHTCPVSTAESRETLVPQAKMAGMRLLRLGRIEPTRAQSQPLYACTGCGACTEFCQHRIEVGPALFRGRAEAERDGRGHPALAGFVERWTARSRHVARQIRRAVPAKRRPGEAEVAWMPGCDGARLTRPALALFDRIGAGYVAVVAGEQACGGYPLLAAGQPDAFRLHAEKLARALHGFTRVVLSCPACVVTMRTHYPAFGVPLRPAVMHPSEFLEPFAERLPMRAPLDAAFYHDPCYLGRHLGHYEPPRRLARKAVRQLLEFSRARSQSECSGGGGLLPLTMPETARAIASARVREMRQAGVDTVVTGCVTSVRRLAAAGVRALDLLEVLEQATR
jgi:Fe-S oxidoreductase